MWWDNKIERAERAWRAMPRNDSPAMQRGARLHKKLKTCVECSAHDTLRDTCVCCGTCKRCCSEGRWERYEDPQFVQSIRTACLILAGLLLPFRDDTIVRAIQLELY